ncbi:alkaline phosphatase family protein [Paraburkholderia youngii]|uniref:alkaline phosphatase family protein n=1 Tax=Paraburkholderia youngii TaxID=2782701 RepID=UPI003D21A28C
MIATIGSLVTQFTGIAGIGELYGMSRALTLFLATTALIAIAGTGSYRRMQYAALSIDLSRFFIALANRNLPAVSFLKARAFQDGHAGYSDPLDEQSFIVSVVNGVMRSPEWNETAIVIAYDDSDGWYDHVMGPIVFQSSTSDDQLLATGSCGQIKASDPAGGTQNGRCGYGPRLPLLVISPWARTNYIDHEVTDQSSIIRFVKDNWDVPRNGNGSADAVAGRLNGLFDFDDRPHAGRLILDERSGTIVSADR